MKAIFSVIAFLVFFGLFPLRAEGEDWLGEYLGSEVPGYQVLESHIVWGRRIGGPTSEMDISKLLTETAELCQTRAGKALVNIRIVVSVGDVSVRDKSGGITKISPGFYGGIFADCVTRVKKR